MHTHTNISLHFFHSLIAVRLRCAMVLSEYYRILMCKRNGVRLEYEAMNLERDPTAILMNTTFA